MQYKYSLQYTVYRTHYIVTSPRNILSSMELFHVAYKLFESVWQVGETGW